MTALLGVPGVVAMGEELGRSLEAGEVVWLSGELGAGKTTLVQAMLRGMGAETPATSPTYALVHRYPTPQGPVYHVDCYRLRTPEEAHDLDWETLASGRALFIEWPERAGAWAPRATRRVMLAHTPNPEVRRVELG
ncbi:MAG: tRNA (adenosine(37)-N6)-threonylcarbamoyltransferase complex ATPase subunit type 1 TsaE [Gemmatimonadales bacterium]